MTADESAKQFAPFLHLYLRGNPIDAKASQVEQLKSRGVRVHFE
jgi:hypothetical protein